MTGVRVQQTIAATPDRVYRAWLDPVLMRRWLAPRGLRADRVEVDERIGGAVRVWHRDDDQDVGGAEAEIVELVPGRRIVLRWWFVGPGRVVDPDLETRLTVTFDAAGSEATLLTLEHDRLEGLAIGWPDVADNVAPGWRGTLEVLASALVEQVEG